MVFQNGFQPHWRQIQTNPQTSSSDNTAKTKTQKRTTTQKETKETKNNHHIPLPPKKSETV